MVVIEEAGHKIFDILADVMEKHLMDIQKIIYLCGGDE